jgi:hypothetical protein
MKVGRTPIQIYVMMTQMQLKVDVPAENCNRMSSESETELDAHN